MGVMRRSQVEGDAGEKAPIADSFGLVPYLSPLYLHASLPAYRPLTGLVGPKSPLGLGVFSHAGFAIQPRPRLRTLLDGPGPQAHGVRQL